MYYVCFSTATIIASVILFQGFNTTDPANSISLLAGFITTFLGVHLLEISRKPEAITANGHSSLESGLMNPRLSIQGRMSIDGWGGAANTSIGGNIHSATAPRHGRQSSLYRAQSSTLFNAFEEDELEEAPESVGLHRLPEASEGEDDELDEADERTHLHSSRQKDRQDRSRNLSHSPRELQGSSPR